MAAVYQRPMSVLSDAQTTQTVPQRRRRESIEVIDVDSLDDDFYQHHRQPSPGPSRPAQRRRLSTPSEVISLLDSDDEDDNNYRPAQSRLRSPPPRNRPLLYVPPVPPIPGQYAGQGSLPIRRHPPPPNQIPPAVVRPNDEPFPFEANLQRPRVPSPGPSNRHYHHMHNNDPVLPARPLQAAPPSHHVPTLGLGGALIAQNRARNYNSYFGRLGILGGVRRIIGDVGPDEEPPRNALNYFSLGNFGLFNNQADEDDDQDRLLALRLFAEDGGLRDIDPPYNPARAYIRSEYLRTRNANGEEDPYKPEYTHPKLPEPGFGYDFAPKPPPEVIDIPTSPIFPHHKILPKSSQNEPIIIDDDDSFTDDYHSRSGPSLAANSSTSAIKPPGSPTNQTILACARCLDPLVLGNKLTLEAQKNRRIWGLRCGHLIDGKCLKELGQPKEINIPPKVAAATTRTPTTPTPTIDRKGKGKAKATTNFAINEGNDDEYIDPNPNPHPQPTNDNSNSTGIRSRLRSRQVTNFSAATTSSSSASISTPSSLASTSTSGSKKRNTGKSKKQPLLPISPPPEFIWYCPVNGCGKAHRSIKINDDWVPYRDDGDYGFFSTASSSASTSRGRGRGRGRRGRGGGRGRGGVRSRGGVGIDLLDVGGSAGAGAGAGAGPDAGLALDIDGLKGVIPLFL